ncbi:GNAT family N-acetyltransferase [Cellulomonas sp. NPDC089187]|uniref:GNAT family N-acetyltransferase n=1 Tax=Cellulomonas sp. NPDC089187 TaxID=3154970 RepID=UPI0034337808
MEPFELTDGTVLLRTPTAADVDDITRICQDPDIQRWTTVPGPYLREHAVGFVEDFVPAGWAKGGPTWGIRESERLVGMIGLTAQPVRSAEIGWWLDPDARGRGLMGRSVELVIEAAFGRLGLDRVEWRAFAGNEASRAVAVRAGFSMDGCIRGGAVKGEARYDDWVGTLLATDRR